MNRRDFIKTTLAGGASLFLPNQSWGVNRHWAIATPVTYTNFTCNISNATGYTFITNPSQSLTQFANIGLYINLNDGTHNAKALITGAGAGETYDTSIVTDGGMEIWTDATHLSNWGTYPGTGETWNREGTIKVAGSYSARLDQDVNDNYSYINQVVSNTANALYLVSVYVYAASGKSGRWVWDSTGNITLSPPATTWTQFTKYWTPTLASSSFVLARNVTASSSLYYDGAAIQKVKTPSPLGCWTGAWTVDSGFNYNSTSYTATISRN